jgi:hypothetical protein
MALALGGLNCKVGNQKFQLYTEVQEIAHRKAALKGALIGLSDHGSGKGRH